MANSLQFRQFLLQTFQQASFTGPLDILQIAAGDVFGRVSFKKVCRINAIARFKFGQATPASSNSRA